MYLQPRLTQEQQYGQQEPGVLDPGLCPTETYLTDMQSQPCGPISSPGELDFSMPPTPHSDVTCQFLGTQQERIVQDFNHGAPSFGDGSCIDPQLLSPSFEPCFPSTYHAMGSNYMLDNSAWTEQDAALRVAPYYALQSHQPVITQASFQPPLFAASSAAISALPDTPGMSDIPMLAPDCTYADKGVRNTTPRIKDEAGDSGLTPGTRHGKRNSTSLSTPSPKRQRTRNLKAPKSPHFNRGQLICPQMDSVNIQAKNCSIMAAHQHGAGSAAPAHLSCPDCPGKTWKNRDDLAKHKRRQHTRPFFCVFHFAGCSATFSSKNEWKRHVLSQHLLLHYWVCTEGRCAQLTNGRRERGPIFNRKDLFTQHVRRMHASSMSLATPSSLSSSAAPQKKKKKRRKRSKDDKKAEETCRTKETPTARSEFEERLKRLQSTACRERCRLPPRMTCPVRSCEWEFQGTKAWDERMEHVAEHLENWATRRAKGRSGGGGGGGEEGEVDEEDEDPDKVVFGNPHDVTLLDWAASEDVGIIKKVDASGKYKLWNPLEGGPDAGAARKNRGRYQDFSPSAKSTRAATAGSDANVEDEGQDAEGEDE